MGRPMASNLCRKGSRLVVFDINPAPVRTLEGLGARAAARRRWRRRRQRHRLHDAADVGGRRGRDWRARTACSNHCAPGSVIVDMSTIDPLVTDRLAAAAAAQGDRVRRRAGRPAGQSRRARRVRSSWSAPIAATFARVKPLLEAMGTTIHHCGGVGTGMRTKLVNNYLAIISCQLNAEAIALSQRFGLVAREDARRDSRHDGHQRPAQDRVAGEGAQGRHRRRGSRSISRTRT